MIDCLRRSAATIERRTTAEGSLTYAAGQSLVQARQLHAAASELEHLHRLLDGRDAEADRLRGLLTANGIDPGSEFICQCDIRREAPRGEPEF